LQSEKSVLFFTAAACSGTCIAYIAPHTVNNANNVFAILFTLFVKLNIVPRQLQFIFQFVPIILGWKNISGTTKPFSSKHYSTFFAINLCCNNPSGAAARKVFVIATV
jgi:hypothetical protein